MSDTTNLPLTDPDAPGHEAFMALLEESIEPCHMEFHYLYEKLRHEMDHLSAAIDMCENNATRRPLEDVFRDLHKSISRLETFKWQPFEKAIMLAASHYPDVQPPFKEWLGKVHEFGLHPKALSIVLHAYPLQTWLLVLPNYFDISRDAHTKNTLVNGEWLAHIDAFLSQITADVRKADFLQKNDFSVVPHLYVLNHVFFSRMEESHHEALRPLLLTRFLDLAIDQPQHAKDLIPFALSHFGENPLITFSPPPFFSQRFPTDANVLSWRRIVEPLQNILSLPWSEYKNEYGAGVSAIHNQFVEHIRKVVPASLFTDTFDAIVLRNQYSAPSVKKRHTL
jgi:hypothetical protein